MSIDVLRARIVTFDSEIELQRKLLDKLEKDKKVVQRHLSIQWHASPSKFHGGRLKHLEVLDDDDIAPNDEAIDLFRDTIPRVYDPSRIFQLLRRAPNIVESNFHNVEALSPGSEQLVVPSLRQFILGEDTSVDDILRRLSLPALETLSANNAAARLGRGRGIIYGFGRFIPASESPRSDRSHPTGDYISDFSWWNLVRALSTRRLKQLYIVPVTVSPPTDVLESLRQLVSNGANIHVGTEERNFVAA
ncbi:hypothetical protein C8R45DRAFT_1101939 [Mycena sanguinolenta]|nr:hypothetical protein C8R45DRAFT_1101939 [Mycena sanguinolenta]